jgi:hypothetical protein
MADIFELNRDLCARLPYGVKCCVYNNERNQEYYGREKFDITLNIDNICGFLGQDGALEYIDIKPYLRPMSSMTEEEKETYESFVEYGEYDTGSLNGHYEYNYVEIDKINDFINWLNAHHFDYRGLIEKGLALEAPEGMYNNKRYGKK